MDKQGENECLWPLAYKPYTYNDNVTNYFICPITLQDLFSGKLVFALCCVSELTTYEKCRHVDQNDNVSKKNCFKLYPKATKAIPEYIKSTRRNHNLHPLDVVVPHLQIVAGYYFSIEALTYGINGCKEMNVPPASKRDITSIDFQKDGHIMKWIDSHTIYDTSSQKDQTFIINYNITHLLHVATHSRNSKCDIYYEILNIIYGHRHKTSNDIQRYNNVFFCKVIAALFRAISRQILDAHHLLFKCRGNSTHVEHESHKNDSYFCSLVHTFCTIWESIKMHVNANNDLRMLLYEYVFKWLIYPYDHTVSRVCTHVEDIIIFAMLLNIRWKYIIYNFKYYLIHYLLQKNECRYKKLKNSRNKLSFMFDKNKNILQSLLLTKIFVLAKNKPQFIKEKITIDAFVNFTNALTTSVGKMMNIKDFQGTCKALGIFDNNMDKKTINSALCLNIESILANLNPPYKKKKYYSIKTLKNVKKRSWIDINHVKRKKCIKNSNTTNDPRCYKLKKCKICYERVATVIIFPCRHLIACYSCFPKSIQNNHCIYCNSQIGEAILLLSMNKEQEKKWNVLSTNIFVM